MTQTELLNKISEDTGISFEDCKTIVYSLSKLSKDALIDGDTIKIKDFGSFKMFITKERIAHGFGKTFKVNPKKKVKFTPSRNLVASQNLSDYLNRL